MKAFFADEQCLMKNGSMSFKSQFDPLKTTIINGYI